MSYYIIEDVVSQGSETVSEGLSFGAPSLLIRFLRGFLRVFLFFLLSVKAIHSFCE